MISKSLIVMLLYSSRLALIFFSYIPATGTILISVAFLIVAWINFSAAEPTILSSSFLLSVLTWLELGQSGSYGNADIMNAFAKVSVVGSIIGVVFEFILKLIFNYSLRLGKWVGFVILVVLFFVGLVSCYSSTAKEGAISVVPVLVGFWIMAMCFHAGYLLLRYLIGRVDAILSKLLT